MNHKNINKSLGYGSKQVEVDDDEVKLVYLILDYLPGEQVLFQTIANLSPLGEEGGRMFMHQIIDVLTYIHNKKGIAHCDIKLENIMVDDQLNMTFIDFGYAASENLDSLTGMRGSK